MQARWAPGRRAPSDPLDEHAHGRLRDLLSSRIDAGQRGHRELAVGDVVEADHRHVVGDGPAHLAERPEDAESEGVVESEDRVEVEPGIEQLPGGLRAVLRMPRRDGALQSGVVREVGGDEGVAVTLQSQVGGAQLPGPLVRVSAHDGDPATPDGDQVLDGCTCRADVVHRDVVGGPTEDALSEHHEREVDEGQQVAVLSAEPFWTEEQAIGLPQPVGQDRDLALSVAAGLADDHAQVALRCRSDHCVRQLGEVGLPHLRYGEAEQSGPPRPKAPCGVVGSVAELRDRLLHPRAGDRAHVGVVVHHVGHGLGRHAGDERDVAHGHSHRLPAFSAPPTSDRAVRPAWSGHLPPPYLAWSRWGCR